MLPRTRRLAMTSVAGVVIGHSIGVHLLAVMGEIIPFIR